MEHINQELPADLQREILSWMPSKSFLKFICVSKNWASIIHDEKFRDEHYIRSKTRPRVLFTFCPPNVNRTPDLLFHSVYQKEKPLLSSGQQDMRIPNELYGISALIRGLICLHLGTKIKICNPGIKKFVTLPEFGEPKTRIVESFFGYDEVTDVFKVLCSTWTKNGKLHGDSKRQIFTVGSGENSWRPIVCKHHHLAVTNSLCKRGVVYYGGWASPDDKSVLMSFDVRSEEFTVIELPEGVVIPQSAMLVNYNGHIALVNDPGYELYVDGVVQVWVRNNTTREWRGEHVAIPGWRDFVGDMMFSFKGTTGTEELVFVQDWLVDDGPLCVVYYNTLTKSLEKFYIQVGVGGSYHFAHTFLNHVDSLLLMERINNSWSIELLETGLVGFLVSQIICTNLSSSISHI